LEKTRILLADVPQMLRDIVRETLAAERDMEIVGEVTDVNSLRDWLEHDDTCLVIFGGEDPTVAATLLTECSPPRVLALSGRESWLYELRPQRVSLGEISPTRLVEEIRKATRGMNGTGRGDG
jgi:DNA-binding NarL/FixJ family response regulator